jgi:hypothetical protein
MSVLATPRPRTSLPEPAALELAPEPAEAFSTSEVHRWVAVLVVPFILGAFFFALAVGLGEEWLIAPAFLLGPLVMISSYIYLSLTSEANTTS